VFASSRDALKRSLNGIAVEIQGTDFSEVAFEAGELILIGHSRPSSRSADSTLPAMR
jgi:hypothetical protein